MYIRKYSPAYHGTTTSQHHSTQAPQHPSTTASKHHGIIT